LPTFEDETADGVLRFQDHDASRWEL